MDSGSRLFMMPIHDSTEALAAHSRFSIKVTASKWLPNYSNELQSKIYRMLTRIGYN